MNETLKEAKNERKQLIFIALALLVLAARSLAAEQKPNILVIYADNR